LLRFIKENKLGKVLPYQVRSGYGHLIVGQCGGVRIENMKLRIVL